MGFLLYILRKHFKGTSHNCRLHYVMLYASYNTKYWYTSHTSSGPHWLKALFQNQQLVIVHYRKYIYNILTQSPAVAEIADCTVLAILGLIKSYRPNLHVLHVSIMYAT